jgi:hypothetical protein
MKTRDAGIGSDHGVGRRARRGAGAGERAGWRSHMFSDGTCSITLTATLDAQTAERLRSRLRELSERGCERVIVDVSAAIAPDAEAPVLLAAVFQAHPPACEVVAVVPRGSSLDRLLPARVAVAWSLSDARMLLASHPAQRAARAQPGFDRALSARDQHALAVRQVLRWAAQTAGAGDYENALRALSTIERVEGGLPDDWPERRRAWLVASQEQAASPRRHGWGTEHT